MSATEPGRICQVFFRAIHNFFFLRAVAIVLNLAHRPISEAGVSGFVDVSKDTDRRDSVRNFELVHLRVGSFTSLSEPHTSCEMERFWALGHFNLGKCAALPPFDCWHVSLKKTDAHSHDPGRSRDAPARCDRQTAASSMGMRRGRCGGLMVMWDGRRRATRFHGRRLEDAVGVGAAPRHGPASTASPLQRCRHAGSGGMDVTEAAGKLGCMRQMFSRLLNSRTGVSPAMALALERIGWSNAAFWVRRQAHHEPAQVCVSRNRPHDPLRRRCHRKSDWPIIALWSCM